MVSAKTSICPGEGDAQNSLDIEIQTDHVIFAIRSDSAKELGHPDHGIT